MLNEFRKFILRGSIVDLLIGFTVGAAFSTVAKSLVTDLLMPPLGMLLGKSDLSNFFLVLKNGTQPGPYNSVVEAQTAGAVTLNYGLFLNNFISLLVVGFVVFLLIKLINKLNSDLEKTKKTKKGEQEPEVKKCPYCLTNIPFKATKCSACTSELK